MFDLATQLYRGKYDDIADQVASFIEGEVSFETPLYDEAPKHLFGCF